MAHSSPHHLTRRSFFVGGAGLLAATLVPPGTASAAGSDYQLVFDFQQILGPDAPADSEAWLAAMKAWRTSELQAISYDDSNYRNPALAWAQRNPIQPQMMIHDRYFYDPDRRRYTVDRYLADVERRYGGIDSVLVWPTYPNIGIDDRNTDDMTRDMPGGVPAVAQLVEDFHRRGVKVLFPIHPWDVGTRDPGLPWAAVLPKTMADIGADGLNGDTMYSVTPDYFANAVSDGRPLVLEPEIGLAHADINALGWNVMSWGYWDTTTYVPMVSRNKWLEPRHQVHVNDRWSTSKIQMLQLAFFHGTGLESWESVWGIWNQLTDRDSAATRMVAAIEREFPDLFTSDGWVPHTPTVQNDAVFGSSWPGAESSRALWTLVNRSNRDTTGEQLRVTHQQGVEYFDLWHGRALTPSISDGVATLSFPIEAEGFGSVLAAKARDLPPRFGSFLDTMRGYAARPLSSYSAANVVLDQKMTPIEPTRSYRQAPESMVTIPGTNFEFTVRGTEIEGGNIPGVDVQYPWESQPFRYHSHIVGIRPFHLDRTPVTNAAFQRFSDATGYRPADAHNFLRDWTDGHYPSGWADKPVTWVSREDALAFCAWAGKRLPHDWEWQYAAQGTDGRNYPWGNAFDPSRVPVPDAGRTLGAPADVTAHLAGASPFGVLDLVGNIWQWTDEFTDDHTRAAVLRGGSHYQAQGSKWYFPSDPVSYRLDHHNKYLLMAPSTDRAGTLGFRCAADAPGRGPDPVDAGTIVDDAASGWTYQGWASYVDLDAYQGAAHGGAGYSGQYAEYTFTGTGVDVYGWRGPTGGVVRISLDGKVVADNVSEYAPVAVYHQRLAQVTGLSRRAHTIRVEATSSTTADQWTMIDLIRTYRT